MPVNLEFKAYYDKPLNTTDAICSDLGAVLRRTISQTDTYFASRTGRLKLRVNDPGGAALVFYDRPAVPAPRTSTYQLVPIESHADGVGTALGSALGVRSVVTKTRRMYEAEPMLINIDTVDGLGQFLEVEVDIARAGDVNRAEAMIQRTLAAFGVSQADVIPWSYAELKMMIAAAAAWRETLSRAPNPGTLFLLDGASCSGKSTLVTSLMRDDSLPLELVPRYSTRERRTDDERCGEYIFVTHAVFREMASSGGFIEYRDFQFGMSYGLPWAEAFSPLLAGRPALGVINLGNVRHVKTLFPEAVTILVDASQETIRQRLISRGVNTPEQIAERLANAARVQTYRPLYDHVVTNEEGSLREAEAFLRDLIHSTLRQAQGRPERSRSARSVQTRTP